MQVLKNDELIAPKLLILLGQVFGKIYLRNGDEITSPFGVQALACFSADAN